MVRGWQEAGDNTLSIRTDATELPYEDRSVTFIRWVPGHKIDTCDDRTTKREWLATGEVLYAAWTGRYRSEVFRVNRAVAKKRLNA
jgi:hypothetical protein